MEKGRKTNLDENENSRALLFALGAKSLRDDLDGLETRIERLRAFLKEILLDKGA